MYVLIQNKNAEAKRISEQQDKRQGEAGRGQQRMHSLEYGTDLTQLA